MAEEYIWLIQQEDNEIKCEIDHDVSPTQLSQNNENDAIQAYNAFFQLADEENVEEFKSENRTPRKGDFEVQYVPPDETSRIYQNSQLSEQTDHPQPFDEVDSETLENNLVEGQLMVGGRMVTVTSRLLDFMRYSGSATYNGASSVIQTTAYGISSVGKGLLSTNKLNYLSDCAVESFGFAVSRTKAFTKYYATSLISDDPEFAHKTSLRNPKVTNLTTESFERLPFDREKTRKRLFLSSLPWMHRQLLHSTRDVISPSGTSQNEAITTNDYINLQQYYNNKTSSIHSHLSVVDTYNFVEKLIDAAERGDHEAIHLIRVLTMPPKFAEMSMCSSCFREFNTALFRHHCRNCGKSFCSDHSFHERTIYRYGYTEPVRVCISCCYYIDAECRRDKVKWLLARIEDYLNGVLLPYFDHGIDRGIDKAMRVVEGTIYMVKNIAFSFPARIVIETVDILRRYGLSGLAGVLLRKDFMEAAETLKKISGMDKSYPMSLHELTACIYYKIAIERGLRGCDPDGEYCAHYDGTMLNNDLNIDFSVNDYPVAGVTQVTDYELDDILRFAPMALISAYEESPVESQRIAHLQGWKTLSVNSTSEPEKPAYALFASDIENNSVSNPLSCGKEAVLVIRGTHTIHDIVTDIRAAPHHFPPKKEVIQKIITGPKVVLNPHSESMLNLCGKQNAGSEDWEWLPSPNTKSYACGGILQAAIYILSEVGEGLLELYRQGYKLRLVGHSLGGAVAALVTYMLKISDSNIDFNDIHCFSYASPCCVDEGTAEDMKSIVTNVVLHDDVVPRLTPTTLRLLLKDLMTFRTAVFRHVQQDWSDVISRAGTLWSPRWRATHNIQHNNNVSMSEDPKVNDSQKIPIVSTSGCDMDTSTNESNDSVCRGISSHDTFIPAVGDCVVIEEKELIQLYQPGKVAHIYSVRGIYKIVYVPLTFASLRKVEVQGNMFRDHSSVAIFEALQEVRSVRRAICKPPKWMPYDSSDSCACCRNRFTWHSTFRGEAQEYRERYNCRSCGNLVCDPCSTSKQPVPRLGLITPSRVCDSCFYTGAYTHETNPTV